MAFGALASLEQILNRILDLDLHRNIFDVSRSYVERLRHSVSALQSFLEDYPLEAWEERIRDATYGAEHTIESLILNRMAQLRNLNLLLHTGEGWQAATAPAVLLTAMEAPAVLFPAIAAQAVSGADIQLIIHKEEFDRIMKEIRRDIKKISMEVKEMKVHPKTAELDEAYGSDKFRHTAQKAILLGFEDELMSIKNELVGNASGLQIISITGVRGIGKTTLARSVYEDRLIVEHFNIRIWVKVSENFPIRDILIELSLNLSAMPGSVQSLILDLYQSLIGRRYLIVLDDMWTTEMWDKLKIAFPDDNNGSRVILTSTDFKVASYPDPVLVIQLQPLNRFQSWALLKQKVFAEKNCSGELERIGKEILSHCHGLPLAIEMIAGILSNETSPDHWLGVAEILRPAPIITEFINGILDLSYKYLPHYLRSCFLYMCCFPQGYKICVSRLIKLWVAEGFLKPTESKSPEEVAEMCLEDLIQKNIIFVISRRSNGKIKYCAIHDVFWHFCIKMAQKEQFYMVDECYASSSSEETVAKVRRLRIHSNVLGGSRYSGSSGIRTAFFYEGNIELRSCLGKFRLLRVFHMLNFIFSLFPTEVLKLLLLRYLAFTCEFEQDFTLPASLSQLEDLQTLILVTRKRIHLPPEIWRMPQLRHLLFVGCCIFTHPYLKRDTVVLRDLQTLSKVQNFTFSTEILDVTPNLKKLGIVYSANITRTQWESYQLQNLALMSQLERLSFKISDAPAPLLVNLAFPETLRELTLDRCSMHWDRMPAMVGSLPNLEVLKLRNDAFSGPQWETREGDSFPKLKVLLLRNMITLRLWITERDHFPRLQRLGLCDCHRLAEIPSSIGEITTLELIEVERCSSGIEASARQIRQEQQEMGNDLQVHISR